MCMHIIFHHDHGLCILLQSAENKRVLALSVSASLEVVSIELSCERAMGKGLFWHAAMCLQALFSATWVSFRCNCSHYEKQLISSL